MDEDAYILAQRARRQDWHALAAALPGRTADSVRNRWHRLTKEQEQSCVPDYNYERALARFKPCAFIQAQAGTLVHEVTRERQEWSEEEDRIILEAVTTHGKSWRKIARMLLPKRDGRIRTDSAVRNRYMRIVEFRDKQASSPAVSAAAPALSFVVPTAAAAAAAVSTAIRAPDRRDSRTADTVDTSARSLRHRSSEEMLEELSDDSALRSTLLRAMQATSADLTDLLMVGNNSSSENGIPSLPMMGWMA